MIDKNKFYDDDDLITSAAGKRIWNNISKEIKPVKARMFFDLEFRSFAFGIAATIILFLSVVGLKTSITGLLEQSQTVDQKINNLYLDAISKFETTLPMISYKTGTSSELDILAVKKEQLKFLNEAIDIFLSDEKNMNQSSIMQVKLRELYKKKLQILNEIVAAEGKTI